MEPLISKASSSGSDIPKHSKAFHRRSDAIAYGSPYQKAAALVDLAEDGIGLPEQVLEGSRFERAAKFYFFYIKFDLLWSLNIFALLLLNFFEKPLWCDEYTPYTCNDRDYFFLGQLPYLTNGQSLVYEGVTVFILLIYVFFPVAYEGCLFWRNPLNTLKGITNMHPYVVWDDGHVPKCLGSLGSLSFILQLVSLCHI